jgi:hypothetical protein
MEKPSKSNGCHSPRFLSEHCSGEPAAEVHNAEVINLCLIPGSAPACIFPNVCCATAEGIVDVRACLALILQRKLILSPSGSVT